MVEEELSYISQHTVFIGGNWHLTSIKFTVESSWHLIRPASKSFKERKTFLQSKPHFNKIKTFVSVSIDFLIRLFCGWLQTNNKSFFWRLRLQAGELSIGFEFENI
jgi:hypothetical protein